MQKSSLSNCYPFNILASYSNLKSKYYLKIKKYQNIVTKNVGNNALVILFFPVCLVILYFGSFIERILN